MTKQLCKCFKGSLKTRSDDFSREMRILRLLAYVTAAETGLVLSTLHTLGAAKTVDRIIDGFRPINSSK